MYFHVTPIANLDAILSQGLTPSIGERSAALGERHPRIYLFTSREACEQALMGWLGDAFVELADDGLVILAIDPAGLTGDRDADYEMACHEPIAPGRIAMVLDFAWLIELTRFDENDQVTTALEVLSEADDLYACYGFDPSVVPAAAGDLKTIWPNLNASADLYIDFALAEREFGERWLASWQDETPEYCL